MRVVLVRTTTSANSMTDWMELFKLYEDNILTPGPNNDFVKYLNQGLGDLQNWARREQRIRQRSKRGCDALNSIGQSLGF